MSRTPTRATLPSPARREKPERGAVRALGLAVAVIGASAYLAACGAASPRVSLSGTWPEVGSRDYDAVVAAWTRRGTMNAPFSDGMDRLLDVSATFHSPQWRAAYVERRARREMLPPDRKAELLAEQHAIAEKYYEVMLMVQTHTTQENDLGRGKQSIWRVALVDSSGKEVEPIEIKRVRTPWSYVRAYYPAVQRRHQIYLARFPREAIDIFAPGARQFSLKMAGARGGVQLFWKAGKD